jgi:hypothetical protein
MNYHISQRNGKYVVMTELRIKAIWWLFMKKSRVWVRSDRDGNPSCDKSQNLQGFDDIEHAFSAIRRFHS